MRSQRNKEMTDQEARKLYDEYDTKFRAAKRQGNHKVASQWKAKRDALEAQVDAAIKRTAGK